MIDETILDKLIPVPDESARMDDIRSELEAEKFPVTNFSKGGVFYTLARIAVRVYIELLQFARTILNSCFAKHAEGDWLDIKAADYGKARKEPVKAKGYVTIYRNITSEPLAISKGHIFKATDGKRFYAVADTTIEAGIDTGKVLVEAAKAGSAYNVSPNVITSSMIYLSGVDRITNGEGWLYQEGTNEESDESLRERCVNSYAELAELTIREKLRNVVKAVPGVVACEIDDQHPRGQGTVDIYVTGSAGQATPELLSKVTTAIQPLQGQYEDYLVKSSEVYQQDFDITIYLSELANTDGVKEFAEEILTRLLRSDRREPDRLYLDSIIQEFSKIPNYRMSEIRTPKNNVFLDNYRVIVIGTVNIQVQNIRR